MSEDVIEAQESAEQDEMEVLLFSHAYVFFIGRKPSEA